ncbi:ABC transporter ATP-binding protein [Ornithinibacillus sp. FSL M8-0202]|uniref:ABC transporter ATP-binding protein n=1 Tax=Ornithinibacillus sp. FSL M8-0202 TaxID=2921616 RepID=UPI0030CCF10B
MSVYKRILIPLVHEKFLTILSVFAGILSALLNLTRPLLLGLIVDSLIQSNQARLWNLILLYAISWVFTWGLSILVEYLSGIVSQNILKELRNQVFNQYLSLPFIEIESIKQGKIESIVMSDLPEWTKIYGTVLAQVVHSFAQLIGALIAISNVNTKLTILMIPFLIFCLTIPWFIRNRLRKISFDTQQSKAYMFQRLTGMIAGIQDLISLRQVQWGKRVFQNSTERILKNELRQNLVTSLLRVSGSIAETAAYMVIMVVGSIFILQGEIMVAELITVLATIELLFYPVRSAGDLYSSIQYSIGAATRVWEFLDKEADQVTVTPTPSFKCKDLEFVYKNGKKGLTDITFQVERGEFIAIVGPSGSGKSTLLKLISGVYQPSKGSIKYDEWKNNGQTAVLWQEPYLFNVSLGENITFNQEFKEDQIHEKLKAFNLLEVVESLPHKLHTIISDNGRNVSSGQKRRIALLRSILINPDLLILDEPTSGLDKTNRELLYTLLKNMDKTTRITSTHEYELAKMADKVIVLANGQIIEMGIPDELWNQKGAFYKLFYQNEE